MACAHQHLSKMGKTPNSEIHLIPRGSEKGLGTRCRLLGLGEHLDRTVSKQPAWSLLLCVWGGVQPLHPGKGGNGQGPEMPHLHPFQWALLGCPDSSQPMCTLHPLSVP